MRKSLPITTTPPTGQVLPGTPPWNQLFLTQPIFWQQSNGKVFFYFRYLLVNVYNTKSMAALEGGGGGN